MTEEVNSSLLRQNYYFTKRKYVVNPTRAIRTVHPDLA